MSKSRAQPFPTDDPPATRAWRSLVRVTGLMRRLSEPHFASYGLSGAQWGVLRTLSRLEARKRSQPRMNELGAELLVQPPSLSATVSRMVRMGLVTRRGAEDDHRGRRIGLTDAGRERLARALPEHQEWVSSMLAGLSESERDELGTLLDRLAEHLSLQASGPGRPRDVSPRIAKHRARSSRTADRRTS